MLEIKLFGQFDVRFDGQSLPVASRPVQSLFAYLVLHAGRAERRERLAGLIWPESSEENARSNLRHALWRLRKALSENGDPQEEYILADDLTVAFNGQADYWLDVAALEEEPDQKPSTAQMIEVAGLYQGELLPGFYNEWVTLERERLQSIFERRMQALLDQLGNERRWAGVVEWGERWLALGGLSEAAFRALMLAHHEMGDQAGVAAVYQRCAEMLDQELGVAPSAQTQALYDDLVSGRPATPTEVADTVTPPPPESGPPPYKGLFYFDRHDVALFFGRERLTAKLVDRLGSMLGPGEPAGAGRFLAIVGASGSGKSSLVRAGLVAALSGADPLANDLTPPAGSEQWPVHLITPTAHPLEALALSLTETSESVTAASTLMADLAQEPLCLHLHARKRFHDLARQPEGSTPEQLLLIVDQFEELFTLCANKAERQAFVDNLMAAAGRAGPVVVVIVLRADFYAHCAQYDHLRLALEENQVYIGPMDADELGRAISKPAEVGGWLLEEGLSDHLLQEVNKEPGGLPLLSHALLETWQRRQGRTMTFAGYAETGGVRGAIGQTAERVLKVLNDDQQAMARHIFLQLTELGNGTEDTRRRAHLADLLATAQDEDTLQTVLEKLVEARLVTVGQENIEVAHEVLIREWPTLRRWLDDNRTDLLVQRQLSAAALEWQSAQQDASYLLGGTKLNHFEEWAGQTALALAPLEKEYLQASIAAREARQASEQARQQREDGLERRSRRLLLSLLGIMILATFGALALAGLARRSAGDAEAEAQARATQQAIAEAEAEQRATQEAVAEAQARLATARELALAATNNLEANPELGVLLAMQAVSATYAVDGTVLAEAEIALHEALQHSRLVTSVSDEWGAFNFVTFSPDGRQVATWGQTANNPPPGEMRVWDARTGQRLRDLPGARAATTWSVANLLVTIEPGEDSAALHVWQLDADEPVAALQIDGLPPVANSDLSQDGARAAFVLRDGRASVWDLTSGEELATFDPGDDRAISYATFSPDGQVLAAACYDGTVLLWDVDSGRLVRRWAAHLGPTWDLAFSRDGKYLFSGGGEGAAKVWDLASGEELLVLGKHKNEVYGIALSEDESLLATAGWDSLVKVWDLRRSLESGTATELLTLGGAASQLWDVAFSPDGRQVAAVSSNWLRIWDISLNGSGEGPTFVNGQAPGPAYLVSIALSPDGTRLAAANADLTPKVWDTRTGRLVLTLSGHTGMVDRIAYSPDGAYLVTVSHDNTIAGWDAASGERIFSLEGYNCDQDDGLMIECDVAFSPDGQILATGDKDGDVVFLDFPRLVREGPGASGLELRRLPVSAMKVIDLAFSGDGRLLATGGEDKIVEVWDTTSGERVDTFIGHDGFVYSLLFAPESPFLVTAGQDGIVYVWSLEFSEQVGRLPGHTSSIIDMAFSLDPPRLATASYDGTVRVWDVNTNKITVLSGHTGGVGDVAFSPDGRRLYTGSADGTSRTYILDIDELMALARQRAGRPLAQWECETFLHLPLCP